LGGGLGGQEIVFWVRVVFVLFVEMVVVGGRRQRPVSEEIWGGGSRTRGDAGGGAEKLDDVDEGGSDSEESVGVRGEREKVPLGEEEALWDGEGGAGGEEGGNVLGGGSVWNGSGGGAQDVQQQAESVAVADGICKEGVVVEVGEEASEEDGGIVEGVSVCDGEEGSSLYRL